MPFSDDGVNRRSVRVDLKDVYGNTITDKVCITFYNQRASSLNQQFNINFSGSPVILPEVPAFPFGAAMVEIQPTTYRFKNLRVEIPAGDGAIDLFAPTDRTDITFFVDPKHATPKFPDCAALEVQMPDLFHVLDNSNAHGPAKWWSPDWWNAPANNPTKAGLLNLYAKMKQTVLPDKTTVFTYVREIWRVLPARLFSIVDSNLLDLAKNNPAVFHQVSEALHKPYNDDWRIVDSYKTYDVAGNLQLTFAEDKAGEFLTIDPPLRMSDTDIDDHQDIRHAFDVIQHTMSGTDSNPYDIHEILVFFQNIDPIYKLV